MTNVHKKITTPVGQLTLIANDQHLLGILWPNENPARIKAQLGVVTKNHAILKKTELQLAEFFAGTRTRFDLPIKFLGTDFQIKVWKALQQIPFAQTRSYSDLAHQIGSPKSCRAVGAANGKNPISVIVPCHRVIGKNGTLTGFAGGLKTKEFLINHEQNAHK